MSKKLEPFLVPQSVWGFNARNVGRHSWEVIKTIERYKSKNTCCICGKNQSHDLRDLHTHEFWEYDFETKVAKITSIETVCKQCHEIIHLSRTLANCSPTSSYFAQLNEHFIKVNKLPYDSQALVQAYAVAVNEETKKAAVKWKVNIDIIGTYGLPIPKIVFINRSSGSGNNGWV